MNISMIMKNLILDLSDNKFDVLEKSIIDRLDKISNQEDNTIDNYNSSDVYKLTKLVKTINKSLIKHSNKLDKIFMRK